ncbi:hypothetical protein OBBRIDRAFT_763424 [Obba rivulosa]|uniref:Transmembrane protein n=1 Tax=Obba rivulosa TaxID=1052685 RepID=A0A8E2DFR7_9APHY|nr:hypothetical protein OBBRIDRAFT_763424 [Obba rivulosa]
MFGKVGTSVNSEPGAATVIATIHIQPARQSSPLSLAFELDDPSATTSVATTSMMAIEHNGHHMVFASVGWRVLSSVLHLLGVSVLAHFLSRRIRSEDVTSLHGLRSISWPRILVIMAFILSWSFLFSSAVIIQGSGLTYSETVCSLGVINCIVFYTSSKVAIYLFLLEKVHVVWSLNPSAWRFRSPMYILGLTFVSLYGLVAVVAIIGRVAYFREDGSCVIGLKRAATISLLTYDLTINIVFTALFLWPIYRARFRSARIRRVAVRTTWAAAVALTTSCLNIFILTLMHGRQLGWVCLSSCVTDVVINASVLFWVTISASCSADKRGVCSALSSDDSQRVLARASQPPSTSTTLVADASAVSFAQAPNVLGGPRPKYERHDTEDMGVVFDDDMDAEPHQRTHDMANSVERGHGLQNEAVGHVPLSVYVCKSVTRHRNEQPDADLKIDEELKIEDVSLNSLEYRGPFSVYSTYPPQSAPRLEDGTQVHNDVPDFARRNSFP